nr:acyltransferase [Paenibacillus dendritiformis]
MLVIAIHTGPLMSLSSYADFMLTGIAAHVAVPFFFIASGFLLFRRLTGEKVRDQGLLHRFIRRIGLLYAVSIMLYLPLNGYAGYFAEDFDFLSFLRDLVFNGTFYHLWYLPAVMLGTYITYFLYRTLPLQWMLAAAGLLYIAGLLGDSYYGVTEQLPVLRAAYAGMFTWFDYTRNGIFFAPLYIAIGAWTAARSVRLRSAAVGAGLLLLSLALLFLEGMALHAYGMPRPVLALWEKRPWSADSRGAAA